MKGSSILLALGLTIVSCQTAFEEQELTEKVVPTADHIITATYEVPGDTRTSVNENGNVLWSEGDAFALISADGKGKFTLVEGAKTATGQFAGTSVGNAPYYAVYPYSEDCKIEDNALKFKIPQEQAGVINSYGSFGKDASPAVATLASVDTPAQFKNLCGVVELSLVGSGVKLSRIAIQSLCDEPLWGDCSVALDGKQGTDEQTMTVTGGSNEVFVNLDKEYSLMTSTYRKVAVVLPAGTLSKGFTIKAFDSNGKAIGFVSTQNSEAKIIRSFINVSGRIEITKDNSETKDPIGRGFLKEIFMDSGMHLADLEYLAIGPYLDWDYDYMLCSAEKTADSLFQQKILVGSDDDLNGALLYPDGEPRYRMVYMNGGTATNHGRTLAESGRSRYIAFIDAGGSYFGTCAGAFIASTGTSKSTINNKRKEYLGIFPSYVFATGALYDSTGMFIPKDSPLLDYYDFGGDYYIDSVKHAGGCKLPDESLPAGGKILLRYDYPSTKYIVHNYASAWAYKADSKKGRVVACGSHPERSASGERRDLMAAFCRYAVDGNGLPEAKAKLENGMERVMDQLSTANKPQYARIGDKQYHHFIVNVPAGGVKNFKLTLAADDKYDLDICLNKGDFAWRTDADFVLVKKGANKELTVDSLSEGTWYVSVYCATCVKIKSSDKNMRYIGDETVLNGVPYTIKASWE